MEPPPLSHHSIHLLPRAESLHICDDPVEEALPRFAGAPGGVGGDEEIVEAGGAGDEEGVVGGGRFGRQDIDGGSADRAGLQGGDEVGFVDEITASGVDEDGTGFHQFQGIAVDEMAGLGSERAMLRDGVGSGKKGRLT